MKNYKLLTSALLGSFLILMSCEKKITDNLSCNQIQLNKPFTAGIDDEFCLEGQDWKIKFGPFVEDSRCNVPTIQCVWAGRFVMGATITNNGEVLNDTFIAEHNWQDTLYNGPYKIILKTVKPEIRTSMEPLAPSAYSFEMLVTQ
ncbi:MAG: hypothetical protein M3R25_13855 [Bacteroidota bacterium]|nr:hypothetical protein [Bacteroidota bacterium]